MKSKYKKVLHYFQPIFWALVLAILIRSLLFELFTIPSGSMKRTLLIGDRVLVTKYTYGFSRYSFPLAWPPFQGRIMAQKEPERGDIVVFQVPNTSVTDSPYIKRLIGLPGDRIKLIHGVLYINGQAVPRESAGTYYDPDAKQSMQVYKETLPNGVSYEILQDPQAEEKRGGLNTFPDTTVEYLIPAGHYFFLGDNRDHSIDSRYLRDIGYIPYENFKGKARLVLFSSPFFFDKIFKGFKLGDLKVDRIGLKVT